MSKTIKELADELGVRKQTIQYHYQRLLAKDRQKDARGFNVITPRAEQDIREKVAKSLPPNNQQRGNKDKTSENAYLIEQIKDLKRQRDQLFATKEKELASKDRQIESLEKMLDQAQQLQLIAEQKIANQTKEIMTAKYQKRGFWFKLFNH